MAPCFAKRIEKSLEMMFTLNLRKCIRIAFLTNNFKVGVCENAIVQRDERFWFLVIYSRQRMYFYEVMDIVCWDLFFLEKVLIRLFLSYANSLYIILNSNLL